MSRPISTVGALIFNAEKCLLVRTHKWKNTWSCPGGKIEYGEDMCAALKREVKEETGLDIYGVNYMLTMESIDSDEFYKKEHFILLNFIAKTNSKDVKLNEEHQEYKWVTISEAIKLDLNSFTRRLIEQVMDKIRISNLAVECIIGVYENERNKKQKLYVSIELFTSLDNINERLDNTIDYDKVKDIILKLSRNDYKLIESFAESVAKEILNDNAVNSSKKISMVKVNIKKPSAIENADYAGIEIVRWS